MKRALYIVAALLAASWVVGFFILKTGMFIHVLMISSALFLMQAVIINPRRGRVTDPENVC